MVQRENYIGWNVGANIMSNNGFPTISNDKLSTYLNFDRDLVLSPADMGKTIIVDGANGSFIILPDARLLLTAPFLSIKNNGTTPVGILDNNGVVIGGIDAGESYILTCTNKSTSSGLWDFNLVGAIRSSFSASSLASTGGASPSMTSICMMTATTGLVFYCGGGGTPAYYPYITPFTIVNGSISFGTTQAAGTMPQASGGSYGIVRLAPTTAFAYLGQGTNGYPYGCIVTMNGLSLSFSTPTVLVSTAMNNAECRKISDGKLVIVYTASSGSYGYSQVITISGTTITTGSLVTVYSGITSGISICKINPNLCAVSYAPSTGNLYAVMLSISGTTITVNSATSLATLANGISGSSIVCMKNGLIGVLYQLAYAAGTKITTATFSGVTITVGSTIVLNTGNSPPGYCKITAINKKTMLAAYIVSNNVYQVERKTPSL